MPDDSVRSHLEAIRDDRGSTLSPVESLYAIGRMRTRARAALRLLDEADEHMRLVRNHQSMGAGCCVCVAHADEARKLIGRLDSVCGASTENTPC